MSWSCHQARALKAIFAALHESGIEWLVLRNHEGLPESNRSKDIDLGFAKANLDRAHQIVAPAAKASGFDRVLVEDFQYVRCLTFFGFFADGAQSLKVDLLDGFVQRGAQLFGASELFAGSQSYHGFRVPDQTADAVMLWMKPLLTGGIVKPRYVPDVIAANEADPNGFRAHLVRVFGEDMGARAWHLIQAGRIEETIPLQRPLRRVAWGRAFRRAPGRTLRAAVHHYFAELRRRSRRKPGTFLAIAGPDGTGKTSFVNHFAEALAELQVKDRDAMLIEHFRPHILPNIKELLKGKRGKTSLEEFQNPHRAAPAARSSSVLRILYYWLDYVVGYWLRTRRRTIAGRTVIFDRYFYDFIVDPRRSRLHLPRWVATALLRITPEPDIVFFLDCDPDIVYARKQELPLDEIARQLDVYRTLAKTQPNRFVRLDATQQLEVLVDVAVRELVTRSYRRFSTPDCGRALHGGKGSYGTC